MTNSTCLITVVAALMAAAALALRSKPGMHRRWLRGAWISGCNSQREQWLEMFALLPSRSGQLFVVPREHEIMQRDPLYRFMHGSPWDYDTKIPILFYGAPFIRQGIWNDAVAPQDIAPQGRAHRCLFPTDLYRAGPEQRACGRCRVPRIVVVMVLDAMRADYFDKYADVLPTLSRMRREGAWFSEARYHPPNRDRRRPCDDWHRSDPRSWHYGELPCSIA